MLQCQTVRGTTDTEYIGRAVTMKRWDGPSDDLDWGGFLGSRATSQGREWGASSHLDVTVISHLTLRDFL